MDKLDSAQQKTFTYLQEVERVSQDILTLREEKMKLANSQNKNREALRALEQVYERNTWMQLGSVRIERPTEECKAILRNDLAAAEERLKSLHEEIKDKVHKLRDLEHEPRLEGFALKPISLAEAKALHAGFGNV
ncbi:p53 and DNA damage-regulated protein 1 isoform X2 [Dendroctonus ponderosae]|uniref:P53 and DNA damage-regulated protein 1 n=1 Tax=Dendroctonus ponderosae TaxID=77166 RepID=A0AAR5PKA0_DENPD|nr:p53 and DNA damage-regulated protein 1 isoform X2 [Dendroctonus ponderosae]KAH0999313.1 hypothetical protein HUJ04_006063 [Dendroctonus ponderosae]KAH1007722.1 hypothetical protein HUJ04_004920 [Dendroctonus ponderosae]KAH1007726.1 hypothetical protein HUJ04_004924 [Dendroctonus ponderosae]KAH1015216.1 hypothetical protein HUJ05_012983 [Dendroctonus ponderosae]